MNRSAQSLLTLGAVAATVLSPPTFAAHVPVSLPVKGPALLSYVPSNGGICLVRPDGSHALRVSPRWKVWSPTWSPSGRYVAFGRPTGPDQSKISVADARGRRLWTFGAGHNDDGALWSPDGSRIAYFNVWAHAYGLAVARPNGSDDHGIAGSPGFPTYGPANPAWTADGSRLAFDDGNGVDTPQGIFTAAAEGGDRRMLVANAEEPAFSPDGTKLAYVARNGFAPAGLVVEDADGTNPRVLTSSSAAGRLAWSPDGSLLAYLDGSAVVVVRADGSDQRVIASGAVSRPAWSPGGKFVAFLRAQGVGAHLRSAIVVARADGGGERTIVTHVGKNPLQPPSWRAPVALPRAERPACPRH